MPSERLPNIVGRKSNSLDEPRAPGGLRAPKQIGTCAAPDETYHTEVGSCCVSYGCCTQAGADQHGTKTNQDSWTAIDKLAGSATLLLGVFDGHGSQGHCVSRNVAILVPRALGSSPMVRAQAFSEALLTALPECNQQLHRISTIDCDLSGCTAVVALMAGRRLVVGNLGDSRCIVGRVEQDGSTSSVAMSRDHTPEEPEEHDRIINHGGEVRPYMYGRQPVGPMRIWEKDGRAPGLCMTRSLGDWVAAGIGLVDEPEVMARQLMPNDRYLILMSDGVFEFMECSEVVEMVHQLATTGLQPHQVAARLVREARRRWQQEEDDIIDDCTAIVAFLDVHQAIAMRSAGSAASSSASTSATSTISNLRSSITKLGGSNAKAVAAFASSGSSSSTLGHSAGKLQPTSSSQRGSGSQLRASGSQQLPDDKAGGQARSSSPASLAALLARPLLGEGKKKTLGS